MKTIFRALAPSTGLFKNPPLLLLAIVFCGIFGNAQRLEHPPYKVSTYHSSDIGGQKIPDTTNPVVTLEIGGQQIPQNPDPLGISEIGGQKIPTDNTPVDMSKAAGVRQNVTATAPHQDLCISGQYMPGELTSLDLSENSRQGNSAYRNRDIFGNREALGMPGMTNLLAIGGETQQRPKPADPFG